MSDASARARALDPHTSFIVRAPAGSGKTELLIQRYLRLLANVEAPESIVAITFTRKAAAEMRTRVLDALNGARKPKPDEPHKALTWDLARAALDRAAAANWQLLDNPARVSMQTIDSLCVAITRQMPWLARFGAVPEIIEKAKPLYAEAARHTLLGNESVEAIKTLLLHLDNNFGRAQSLIAQMLERRDQWLRHLGQATTVRSQVELCLETLIEETLRDLHQAAQDTGLTPLPNDLPAWHELAESLLTTKHEWRKKSSLAQSLSNNDRLLDCFKRLRHLPPAQYTDTQWRAMEAIVELLPIAAGNLELVFRERGAVDFIELTLASLRALADSEGPSDLGLALGCRLEHILLDEFQDTSYTQYALLERLTQTWDAGDGRTLFLVGDPMQSIYRFRQAEVGLFLEAWRSGITNVELDPLTLSVNFRSDAAIVDWVNHTFSTAFPQVEDPVLGAVSYTVGQSISQPLAPAVNIHASAGENTRTEEADRVANIVIAARDQGTVGILVRARSHLPEIVAALKQRGVRYQAIEIDELGDRAVIQDLMALTFALLHPADRISFLAVLRAPWCGLTLEQLHSLDQVRAKGDPRLTRTFQVLEAAIADRGRRTLRELVEQTWMRLGGPACVASDSDLDDAAAYFDLLDSLGEGGDLSDFKVLRESVEELFAQPDPSASANVQIMTIHKAKGLEFDTVILPGLGAQPKKDEGQLLLWHEPSPTELLFAPIPESGNKDDKDGVYKYLSRVEQQKSDFEAVRLLYVATTRARRELHLLGCANVKADGTLSAAGGSFLKILWPVLEPHFAVLHPAPAHTSQPASEWQPHAIRRLVTNWALPAAPPPVEWTHTESQVAEQPEITYEWVGDTLRYAGTVVHAMLARIGRDGLNQWNAAEVRSRERVYRAMLMNLGVPSAELDKATSVVTDALVHAVTDERGRWILGSQRDAQCELAISGVAGGQVYETVIDRTFVDEQGTRWIVDYKTGSHTGGSVERFLKAEKDRYREQLERYARLMAQQDDRAIRLGIYYPLVASGWVEWDAPTAMRRQASLFAD